MRILEKKAELWTTETICKRCQCLLQVDERDLTACDNKHFLFHCANCGETNYINSKYDKVLSLLWRPRPGIGMPRERWLRELRQQTLLCLQYDALGYTQKEDLNPLLQIGHINGWLPLPLEDQCHPEYCQSKHCGQSLEIEECKGDFYRSRNYDTYVGRYRGQQGEFNAVCHRCRIIYGRAKTREELRYQIHNSLLK